MNEIRRYETWGTAAMACKERECENRAIIDYEIARRSYEARVRLAQRQSASQRAPERKPAGKRLASASRNARSMTLHEAVSSSYTPNRSVSSTLSSMWNQAIDSIAGHPFWNQLKNGTTAGRETDKVTYKQAFTSATICMALSAVMIFVGA